MITQTNSKTESADSRDLEEGIISVANDTDNLKTPVRVGSGSAVSSGESKANAGIEESRSPVTPITPNSANKKIKFKKAKKLKRITSIASSSYMKHMHDLEGSRFQVLKSIC